MKSVEILRSMLKLQQKLNDETNSLNWEEGYTKEGKLISWRRCIYMECAELINPFAWKHWKNISSPINWENVRTEIVDIWHFILSLLLEEYTNKKDKNFQAIANEVICASVFQDFCKEEGNPSESDLYSTLNDIKLIIHKCSGFGFSLGELLSNYFILAIKCRLNLKILYETCIGKNILNIFRQNNGYKQGTYKKDWNGKEDNEALAEVSEQELNFDTTYKKLEEYYRKV